MTFAATGAAGFVALAQTRCRRHIKHVWSCLSTVRRPDRGTVSGAYEGDVQRHHDRPVVRSFADIRGPGWARFPNLPGGPAGRVTRETLHRIPACITMHRRSPAKPPDVCRDPPAREVSLTAAKDRTFKTVRPNQGTAAETVPIPRRPSL